MDRVFFTLNTALARKACAAVIEAAPDGSQVRITGPRRTTAQSNYMWLCLSDIARQLEHNGRRYDADQWKFIMLSAFGKEVSFLPSLDGRSFVPVPYSTAALTKEDMRNFIEFLLFVGAERGVVFHDPPPLAEQR